MLFWQFSGPFSQGTASSTLGPKVEEGTESREEFSNTLPTLPMFVPQRGGMCSVSSCGKAVAKNILWPSPLLPLSTHPSRREGKLLVLQRRTWELQLDCASEFSYGAHTTSPRIGSSSVAPQWVAAEGRRSPCFHDECCPTDTVYGCQQVLIKSQGHLVSIVIIL